MLHLKYGIIDWQQSGSTFGIFGERPFSRKDKDAIASIGVSYNFNEHFGATISYSESGVSDDVSAIELGFYYNF